MFKLKFFKRKKKPKLVKLVDISTRNLSEWDIMLYITYLWEKYDMYHIGFIFVGANEKHSDRWVLYSYSNRRIKEYFEDRCPAIIEEEILSISNNKDIVDTLPKPAEGLYKGGIPFVKPKYYWSDSELHIDWDHDVDYAYIRDQIKM